LTDNSSYNYYKAITDRFLWCVIRTMADEIFLPEQKYRICIVVTNGVYTRHFCSPEFWRPSLFTFLTFLF